MQAAARTDKELLVASKAFTVENRARTWFEILTSCVVLFAALAAGAMPLPWPVRLFGAFVAGLAIVRFFCVFHDVMHGAILRDSKVGKFFFSIYGIYVLTPPVIWKESHNYHHAHTAKLIGSNIGSYPMATPRMFESLTPLQRWLYRAARHPLNIAFGYFTIFWGGMGLRPFLRSPKKYWDSGVAMVLTIALPWALWAWGGFEAALFGYWLPIGIATATGGYLFYAQHNFPGVKVAPRETWTFVGASLESSSYMEMSPLMHWFTANIGYHHVHHLNAAIPFYRLPEAMAAIPELQHPGKTSFALKDVLACFRLKLWDPDSGEMVGYPVAGAPRELAPR